MASLKIKSSDSNGKENVYMLDMPLSYSQLLTLLREHHLEVSTYIDGVLCRKSYTFVYE